MKRNVGNTDRMLRFVGGIALLSLLFILDGGARYIGLLGLVLIATAAMRFCPAYPLLGMNTCGKGEGSSCCGGVCGKGKDKADAEEPAGEEAKEKADDDKTA